MCQLTFSMLWLSFVPLPEAVKIVFVDVVDVVCFVFLEGERAALNQ